MSITDFGLNRFGNEEKLDFSSALNPLGIPASARKAVSANKIKWTDYPDPDCLALRRKLAVYENIPVRTILCGNGGDDLIHRIVRAVKPHKALIFSPCSNEYRRALKINGCEIDEIPLNENTDFSFSTMNADSIKEDTDAVFICNPNSVTGNVISPYTLSVIAEKCYKTNTLLICDERYLEFVPRGERYSIKQYFNEKVIIIKSFTKIFSMAGLPVGYVICSDENLLDAVKETGSFYGVSVAALAAAEAAADEYKFVRMTRKYSAVERQHLSEELTKLGLPVYHSQTNFLLFRCELPLDRLLARRGIMIKNCAESYGMPQGFFRTSIRMREDNNRLISNIERILQTYW